MTLACRGELRDGDHAEFTLLERKKRNERLDDCVLFATLEPCAPNSRKHPKLGCAERIVLARIKRVWVGIEDPDPTVDRKGIKYLQDNGVEVEMFDADLQEIIRQENQDFLDQASERAAAFEDEPAPDVVLSPLEAASERSTLQDFSTEALQRYRDLGKIPEQIDSSQFNRRLIQQGVLDEQDGQTVPTGFGILLFGNEPRLKMPQAGLVVTIHYPKGGEEVQTFDGPMVLIPNESFNWLKSKLPNVIDRSGPQREEKGRIFYELLREGIVNALVHRDYSIPGARCQLIIKPDSVEIQSPGAPVDPITLEQMQSLNAPVLTRNPLLQYVFVKMGLAEERGLGLKSMREKAVAAGLPLPKYTWESPYLVLTLFPSTAGTISSLSPQVLAELNATEIAGWQWLTTKGRANSPQYAKAMGIDDRTGRRHLQKFVELGLARVLGKGRATKYEVI